MPLSHAAISVMRYNDGNACVGSDVGGGGSGVECVRLTPRAAAAGLRVADEEGLYERASRCVNLRT